MRWLSFFSISFLFLYSQAVYAENSYSILKNSAKDEYGGEMSTLIVEDSKTGIKYSGPKFYAGHIETVKDFDRDGKQDALLVTSCGGNGCPEDYRIVTLKNGKLVVADIESDFSIKYVKEERDQIYIVDQKIDHAHYYVFDGKKLVISKTEKALKAVKEVRGPGVRTDPKPPKTLVFDIDQDKKPDRIVCNVWERWGSLLCKLPLPNGKHQQSHYGCDRFGVLPSTNKGYHEFVCNFDTVVTFDGSRWVKKESPQQKF